MDKKICFIKFSKDKLINFFLTTIEVILTFKLCFFVQLQCFGYF